MKIIYLAAVFVILSQLSICALANENILVMQPGTKSLKINLGKTRTGMAVAGSTRTIKKHIASVHIGPNLGKIKNKQVLSATFSKSTIKFNAIAEAVGHSFTAKVSLLIERQRYTKIGSRYSWRTYARNYTSEDMTVTVDVGKIPALQLSVDTQAVLKIPNANFTSIKSKKSETAECFLQEGNAIIRAKKVGKTSFELNYQIGTKSFKRTIKVTIPKGIIEQTERLSKGGVKTVLFQKFQKKLNFHSWKLVAIVPEDNTDESFKPDSIAGLEAEGDVAVIKAKSKGEVSRQVVIEGTSKGGAKYQLQLRLNIVVGNES